MGIWRKLREANRPGPPEDSLLLRATATGSVLTGIVACLHEHELSLLDASVASLALVLGMAFSYRTRRHPLPAVKLVLAFAMVGAFAWFFHALSDGSGATGQLGAVEAPLAALFVWIQVAHAFDVPSRRDLGFSLAGSTALMAVAAAEALTATFGLLVALWALFALIGASTHWASLAGLERPSVVGAGLSALAAVIIAFGVLAIAPAPRPSSSLVVPSSLAGDLPVANPGGLAGGGRSGTEPARAATPKGPTRIGGFLGLAGPLDTALSPRLSDQVVMRVRAERPTYWIGEVYDHWNGRSWTDPNPATRVLQGSSPFQIPLPEGDSGGLGATDLQTFYMAVTGPNLIFHASDALEVWFPAKELYVTKDGAIRTGVGMGAGTVYTVLSSVNQATPSELRSDGQGDETLPPSEERADLQLPHPYGRVAALARRITSKARTRYGEVQDLIGWIASHTRYSLSIPPLPPGADAVDQFLFVTHRGFCEQIATALAVMLRTLGVPARVAAGYVPGSYDPFTDLWQVEAKDAHSWVQVWFPGYGWQSFDPTASVPLANPSAGTLLLHGALRDLKEVPPLPLGMALVAASLVAAANGWRRRRPKSPAERLARKIEKAGRRRGRPRLPSETLFEYAAAICREPGSADPAIRARLEARAKPRKAGLEELAAIAEREAYGRPD